MAAMNTHDPLATVKTAFDRFEQVITLDDARQFRNTTLKDVRQAALSIEHEQRQRGTLRNMRRLEPLLTALGKFEKPLEVLCNGTPYMPWVWAPIKLMLQLANELTNGFDTLLDAYVQIADAFPRFDRYSNTFSQIDFHNVLALVYADIVEFHRRAYKFFRRRGWQLLFDCTWKGFGRRFDEILKQLRYHKDLVDKDAVSFDMVEASESRRAVEEELAKAEKEREFNHLQSALAWLAAPDLSHQDHLWTLKMKRLLHTCDWFLRTSEYKDWLSASRKSDRVLWLKGKPGSGKTILSAHVVCSLQLDAALTPLYCFCGHITAESSSCAIILRTLAAQLVRRTPDLASLIWDNYLRNAHPPSIENVRKLLPTMILVQKSVRIVIDGLDECPTTEHKTITEQLLALARNVGSDCAVMISSRDEGWIGKKLQKELKISLHDEQKAMHGDMSVFVQERLRQAIDEWDLSDVSESSEQSIRDEILKRANGMFLWTELVISSLKYWLGDDDILGVVAQFPEGLHEAYARIVQKITEQSNAQFREKVNHLYELLTYSRRPLLLDEVLCALAFDPNSDDQHYPQIPSSRIIDLCKPLVEITKSGVVDFVHFSVKEYFKHAKSRYYIPTKQAHLNIVQSCVAYLNTTNIFLRLEERTERLQQIVHAYSESIGVSAEGPDVSLCRRLCNLSWVISSSSNTLPSLLDDDSIPHAFNVWRSNSTVCCILQAVQHSRVRGTITESQMDDANDQNPGSTSHLILLDTVASQYEEDVRYLANLTDDCSSHDIDAAMLESFRLRNAGGVFFCRYQDCGQRLIGFQTITDRDKHEILHATQFLCRVPYCLREVIGFRKKRDLMAHERKHHPTKPRTNTPFLSMPQSSKLSLTSGPDGCMDENLADLDIDHVPSDLKQQGPDWYAIFPDSISAHLSKVTLDHTFPHTSVVCSTIFSTHGTYLATGSNGVVRLYRAATGSLLREFSVSDTSESDHYVRTVAFSTDESCLIAGTENRSIYVWNIATSELNYVCTGHEQDIYAICVSHKHIVSVSGDKTVRQWDIRSGRLLSTGTRPDGLTSVSISSDGLRVAAGSLDKHFSIWTLDGGSLVCASDQVLEGVSNSHHTDSVYSVAFCPTDSNLVATASLDRTIKIWEIQLDLLILTRCTLRCIATIQGHKDYVLSVCWSSDGQWILTGAKDRGVHCYNAKTGKLHMRLVGHKNSVICVARDPSSTRGLTFATSSGDLKARVWTLPNLSVKTLDE